MRIVGLVLSFRISGKFREVPEVKKSLEDKELIHKAKSDNTNLFRNFAVSIGAIPLTCDVHGSGSLSIVLPDSALTDM